MYQGFKDKSTRKLKENKYNAFVEHFPKRHHWCPTVIELPGVLQGLSSLKYVTLNEPYISS